MPFTPLAERLGSLPLVLAGPVLRRTEPKKVTVWVALKAPAEVTLEVTRTRASENQPNLFDNSRVLSSPATETVQLGEHLHVLAVTADGGDLQITGGEIYAYNLSFRYVVNSVTHTADLSVLGAEDVLRISDPQRISYFAHRLPTFAYPPDDIEHLRLAHGSCRKPHDPGGDGLAVLDHLIETRAHSPFDRPQQLFHTGDQIYAEEVMDPLLSMLVDAGTTLIGWSESLPENEVGDTKPGKRTELMRGGAGLEHHGDAQAKSHLLFLSEYYAMYLCAWSQTLWPDTMPPAETGANPKDWADEVAKLREFRRDLPAVRRALANIPSYMIFDDHDVTDDWFISREWCERVLRAPLGKRMIQNALAAYAVFQHWGNLPDEFADHKSGRRLLRELGALNGTAADAAKRTTIDNYIGLPPAPGNEAAMRNDDGELVLEKHADAIPWHYIVAAPKHEVIVLDTRTQRGYSPQSGARKAPPSMMSPAAMKTQLAAALGRTNRASSIEVTCVIAPTNPVGLRIIDLIQAATASRQATYHYAVGWFDYGDAWNFHEAAFARLLATLFPARDHIVLLSGDIHFGYAVRLTYWSRWPFGSAAPLSTVQAGTMAQLTASAFKNADAVGFLTKLLQTKAKSLPIIVEREQDWAGWNDFPALFRKETLLSFREPFDDELPIVRRLDERIFGETTLLGEDDFFVTDARYQPHWRYHVAFAERKPGPGQTRAAFALPSMPHVDDFMAWLMFYNALATTALPGTAPIGTAELAFIVKSPWFQEGDEVVGLHNVGLVSFEWRDSSKVAIQDLYFWPPGATQPADARPSRYRVDLAHDAVPPDLPVRPTP